MKRPVALTSDDPSPRQSWSLRTVLTPSFWCTRLCLQQWGGGGWGMYRINLKTVDALVQQVIGEVAQRVQECTQQDVGHTHTTLNGMFPAVPTAQQAARPLELIENSLQF